MARVRSVNSANSLGSKRVGGPAFFQIHFCLCFNLWDFIFELFGIENIKFVEIKETKVFQLNLKNKTENCKLR